MSGDATDRGPREAGWAREQLSNHLESAARKVEDGQPFNEWEARVLAEFREALETTPEIARGIPEATRTETRLSRRSKWFLYAPLPLAACVLFAVLAILSVRRPPGIGLSARHIEGIERVRAGDQQSRVDTFQIFTNEDAYVTIVFRSWDSESRALVWIPHIWADGAAQTLVKRDEGLEVRMDVSSDPPVTQFLILAGSREPSDLPQTEIESEALSTCLQSQGLFADGEATLSDVVKVVASCLPETVTTVGREFVVR